MNTDILISMLIRRYCKILARVGDHTSLFSLISACNGISDQRLRKTSMDLVIHSLYSAFVAKPTRSLNQES